MDVINESNMELSHEDRQLLEQGLRAREVLSNETITSTINALSNDLTNGILSTHPHEKDKREELWMRHRGLTELVTILKQLDAAAAQIETMVRESEGEDKGMDYNE